MVVRLYVGGLPADVTEDDLKQRFGKVKDCIVSSVDLVMAKEKGRGVRDFAYVNLSGTAEDSAAATYIQTYNNTKWKGKRLRVETALQDFKARLQEEWDVQESARQAATIAITTAQRPSSSVTIKTVYAGTRIVF
ncbi:hypothetical protein AC1031_002344 [Aphanomyces cochlioides]|nr:hypothetical protein AC1031_002344 [Aphanomyces cochlioides]